MYKSKAPLLTFCLSSFFLSATLLSVVPRVARSSQGGTARASTSQNRTTPRKTGFDVISMGELRDKDGVHLGFTLFKASDGSGLTVLYEGFGSPARAQEYFEKQLVQAVRVIERKNKLNALGKVVGERAEILFSVDSKKTMPAVLWIDGELFHEIYSPSRERILELEKVYKY